MFQKPETRVMNLKYSLKVSLSSKGNLCRIYQ